jgi:predicted outer membrane repeat protein
VDFANTTVTVSGLTIRNGGSISGTGVYQTPYDGEGGAILNFGRLTVSNCTLLGNLAFQSGGAIYNAGSMTLSGCAP